MRLLYLFGVYFRGILWVINLFLLIVNLVLSVVRFEKRFFFFVWSRFCYGKIWWKLLSCFILRWVMVDGFICWRLCCVFIVCSIGIIWVMVLWKMFCMKLFLCVCLFDYFWIVFCWIVLLLWIFVICLSSINWFVNCLRLLIVGWLK